MRVEIKTKGAVKDPDIRALFMMREALRMMTDRMKIADLCFALGSHFKCTVDNEKLQQILNQNNH